MVATNPRRRRLVVARAALSVVLLQTLFLTQIEPLTVGRGGIEFDGSAKIGPSDACSSGSWPCVLGSQCAHGSGELWL